MSFKHASLAYLLLASLTAPLALAGPAQAAGATAQRAKSDASMKQSLREAVTRHVARAGLKASLRGYSLSPAIVQLRRYTEPGQKQARTVCIVSLVLKNDHDVVLADIQGRAQALGASPLDALDAAAESAVSRVPDALAKLQGPGVGRVAALVP